MKKFVFKMATYIVYNDVNKLKIGATRKERNVKESLKKRYQTALGKGVKILIFRCDYPFIMEKKVHDKFAAFRDSLELFNVNVNDAINFMHTIQITLQEYHINVLEKLPQNILNLIAEDIKIPADMLIKLETHILFDKISAKTYRAIAKYFGIKDKTKVGIMNSLLSPKKKQAIIIFKPVIFYYYQHIVGSHIEKIHGSIQFLNTIANKLTLYMGTYKNILFK